MSTITNTPTTCAAASSSRPAGESCAPLNYAQLVRRCMGKVELAERLLASFEQRLPLELAEIESSVLAKDAQRLARLTHQLKGTFANVSAEALHAIAIRLEDSACAGRLDEVTAGLLEVREGWAEFNRFKSTLPRPASPPTTTSR